MLTFALVATWLAFGTVDLTCRPAFQELHCSSACQNKQNWYSDGAEIFNFKFDTEEEPTYPGPPGQGAGSCVTSNQYEAVIESSVSCPVTCERVLTRPAQIFFKARVPCHKYVADDGENWAGNGTFTIFNTYSFVLGSGNPRPLHISFTFDGTTWSESIVDVQGDLYANSRGEADNFFHTVMFDLARDGTSVYYNGYLIKAMREGDAEYKHEAEGLIQLAGASRPWWNTMLVKDNTCTEFCSDRHDCSGRGHTPADAKNTNGCNCSCDCDEQDGCWGGPDCSEQTVIPLGGSKSCAGQHLENGDYNDETWDGCRDRCHHNVNCGYFAHNDTNGCRLFMDCSPIEATYSLFQNSARLCPPPDPLAMGSGYVKLHQFLKFQDDELEIYFQTPNNYELLSLEFRSASHPCAQWNVPELDDPCPNPNGYWSPSQLGCLTIFTGTFPFREIYNTDEEINYAGFSDKNDKLRSVLMAEVEEITSHDGTAVKRSYHYIMPYDLEIAGSMALQVTQILENRCIGGATNCPACQVCDPETGNCMEDLNQAGIPCDDRNPHTWPDHCTNGICTGPLICEPTSCPLCQLCVEHLVDEADSPCPGEACSTCIIDQTLAFKKCGDESGPPYENICIQGECVGEDEPCDCKCDQNNCAQSTEVGCGCDHRTCPEGSLSCCDAGYCRQDNLRLPMCRYGKCSQVDTFRPRCNGGYCDQTGATRPTCDGGYCIQDSTSQATCDGGHCSQLGATDATCIAGGCEENACSSVTCPACKSCTLPDGVCELDDNAGGCADCEICVNGSCSLQGLATEGNKCDDGVAATYHDRCDGSGTCVGMRCYEVCEEGGCNQDNAEQPCCKGGGCTQRFAINPMCQAGGCDQKGATKPTCDGGQCDQKGASDPDCSVIPDCSGNCALMSCPDCQKCVDGACVEDTNVRRCDKGLEYFDEVCIQGECSGTHYKCFSEDYNECMQCDNEFGTWSPRESSDPIPCQEDSGRELYCTGGRCLPPIAAAEMLDNMVMEVGVQETMANMRSRISLEGTSLLNWPWKMFEHESFFIQDFQLDGEEVAVSSFTINADCPGHEDENCEQKWSLVFEVDKVCEDVSYYTVNFPLRSLREGEENKHAMLPYAMAVAQVAACGVIISDDGIRAELSITDETYENPNSFPYINVGKKIHFRLSVGTIQPINSLNVLSMTLDIGQNGEWEESWNIIGPNALSMYSKMEVEPISESDQMYWYVYLHPDLFIGWSEKAGTSVRMSLTVEVIYQRRKRRELAIATDGYDFAQDFFLLDYRCVDELSGRETNLESYIVIDCPPEMGRGQIHMKCSRYGFREEDKDYRCGEDIVLQSISEGSAIAWYYWVGGTFLFFGSVLLAWSYIPQKKLNYYCSKLCGVKPPDDHKHDHKKKESKSSDKKQHGQIKNSTDKGTGSRIGEPDPPKDSNQFSSRGSAEGKKKHGHDHSGRSKRKSKRHSGGVSSRKSISVSKLGGSRKSISGSKLGVSRKSISGGKLGEKHHSRKSVIGRGKRRKSISPKKSDRKSPRSVANVRKSLLVGPIGGNAEGARKSLAFLGNLNNVEGARKSLALGKATGRRKSLAAITPISLGQRKSIAVGKMGGRKSIAFGRKSLVGKGLLSKPALQHQISKKEAQKSVVSKGAYTVCSSLADAKKMKQLFAKNKNVKLYE